jgi:hypothetical protein
VHDRRLPDFFVIAPAPRRHEWVAVPMATTELSLPMRLLAGGLAFLASAPGPFGPRAAFAQTRAVPGGPPLVQLEVRDSAEAVACPDGPTLAGAITRALGRDVFGEPHDPPRASLRIEVVFARSGAGYGATVRARGVRTGERTITSVDGACSDLTDAIAVTVAALLDGAELQDSPQAKAPKAPDPPVPPAPEAEENPWKSEAPRPRARPDARTAYNSAFVELFGSGLLYSVNYERLLAGGSYGVRVGVSYGQIATTASGQDPGKTFDTVTIPVLFNTYFGSASHKFQTGGGALMVYGPTAAPMLRPSDSGLNAAATFVVGYRYLARTGGASLGIAWTPSLGAGGFFWLWGGLSLGVVL